MVMRKTTTAVTPTATFHEIILREWQRRLGLEDWALSIDGACDRSMLEPIQAAGAIEYNELSKRGKIYVMDENDYNALAADQAAVTPYDWEEIVVHELLHAKLSLIYSGYGTLQERYVHQLIDDLARALVDAKRSQDIPLLELEDLDEDDDVEIL